MQFRCPPEFFHKNASHEQLLFMWWAHHDSGDRMTLFWQSVEFCRASNKCLKWQTLESSQAICSA